MFQSVGVAAGAWLLAIYDRQSWTKSKVYNIIFFKMPRRCRWLQSVAASCSHLQPLAQAATCIHSQTLAPRGCSKCLPSGCQVAAWASGCQVAASSCFSENQNDARLLALCKFGFSKLRFPKWKPQNCQERSWTLRALNVDKLGFSTSGFPKWMHQNCRKPSSTSRALRVYKFGFSTLGFPKWMHQNCPKPASISRALSVYKFGFSTVGFPKWMHQNWKAIINVKGAERWQLWLCKLRVPKMNASDLSKPIINIKGA